MTIVRLKIITGFIVQNRWVQALIGLCISSFLTFFAIENIAWVEINEGLRNLPIPILLIASGPMALNIILRGARWYLLLPNERIKFSSLLLVQNTGIGVNNISPIRMISEPIQLALITRRYEIRFAKAFTGLIGGNFLDVLASGSLIILGLLFVPALRDQTVSIPILGAFILFGVSTIVFIGVARGIHKLHFLSRFQYFHQVIDSVQLLRERPRNLVLSFAATLGHWIALGLTGWILTFSLGIDISLIAITVILVAATFFTSAVPSAPAGTGTYHFAVVTMFVTMGIDPSIAFSFAIVMHLMSVLPSSAIALIMVWKWGVHTIFEAK